MQITDTYFMIEFIFIIILIFVFVRLLGLDLKQYIINLTKAKIDHRDNIPNATYTKRKNTPKYHAKSSYNIRKKNHTSYADKVKKGKEYEDIIAKLFRCRGYIVEENGKDKGKKDGGIDLIAFKDNETVLIQCKNWKSTSKYKIRHDELKKLRAEGRDFLEEHKEYVVSDMKLLFVLAEDCVHPSAKHHLEDIKNKGKKVDIEIIPIFNAKKEIKDTLDIIIRDRKVCPRCNKGYLVSRSLKNKKYQGKHKQEDFLGCSRFPKCKYSEDKV